MARQGIFGGSFDPVHNGHVAVARAVRAALGLQRVYVVPAARPPHKAGGCVASFEERVAMARLAFAGMEGFEVLDLEGRRPGRSYTVETVEELQAAHPGEEFSLLVGADMLADLPSWHRAADLVRRVRVVAFARPGQDLRQAQEAFRRLGVGANVVEVPAVEASSSEVRRRLREGGPVGGLLPPSVEAYIRRRGLYRKLPQEG